MQVLIKGHRIRVTAKLREHAENKLAGAVERLVKSPAARMEIELVGNGSTTSRRDKECRINLSLPRRKPMHISEVDPDIYRAIDVAHDRLLNVLKRRIGKSRPRRSTQRE